MKADPTNKTRIIQAFPELLDTYGVSSKFHQTLRSGASS